MGEDRMQERTYKSKLRPNNKDVLISLYENVFGDTGAQFTYLIRLCLPVKVSSW